MRNLSLVILFLTTFLSYGQTNDTVPDMGEDCLRPLVDSLEFSFENDSIYISGIIWANCDGPHAIIRFMNQDSISLTATDNCLANCICPFSFSTSFADNGYDEYHLTLGYTCANDGWYEHYLDTIISRDLQFIPPALIADDFINIYPNPCHDKVNIELTKPNEIIQSILIRSISSKGIVEEKVKLNHQHVEMDLSSYRAGVYLLEIRTNKRTIFKSLMVL